ncbi:MAG TPA: hypothetical protein VF765_28010, partial [Polyangiaceae bacterium]
MRKVSLVASSIVVLGVVAGCSSAPGEPVGTSVEDLQGSSELNPYPRHMQTQERFAHEFAGGHTSGGNLSYHGGPTITNAHVVPIFWGPSWASGGSDNAIASTLEGYIASYGTTGEYNVITQYSGIQST